ncbi:MAG: NaeI family type II restriction endonuclease [Polyangiales bacterium]
MGGAEELQRGLPLLIRDAIDFVIDPVRTARTRVQELDNVEKTFIGLKIEHYFRDLLDVPKGLRDLVIEGLDVDVKNTVGSTWMIPPETYRNADPCLLIATAEEDGRCWLGLLLAREEYLNSPNRDQKRAVSSAGFEHILWIVDGERFPVSRWDGLDMERFRELRKIRGGTRRAATFFRENLGRPVHREIVRALLFDQDDYMKRLRGNGGARDLLRREGIVLLSGAYDAARLRALGLPVIGRDEVVAVAEAST